MKNKIYLYHIIYIIFISASFSQNIHLNITGKDSISTTYIKTTDYTKIFQNIKTLQEEVSRIKSNTQRLGYFNSTISPVKKVNDSSYYSELKLNTHFKNIVVSYNHSELNKKELIEILDSSTLITPNTFTCKTKNLESNLNKIINHFSNKGQVFSNFRLTNIRTNKNTVHADLDLTTSKTNYISEIKIKGYERFPKKFIKHYLQLKKNQQLNLEDIEKKSNNLNYLKFASEKKKPEILFTKDSSVAYIYIGKKKTNSFEGFLGFSSNPETNKLDINGNIDLKLINNLNSGEELYIKYKSTENEQRHIHFKTIIPYIFNTPFTIEGQFDIFKKDSSFTNNTQALLLKYNLNKNISTGLGIRLNNSNNLEENNTENNSDFKKRSYLINFSHHSPNKKNSIFKTKTQTELEVSLSNRESKNTTINQQNISLTSEYLFQINKTNTFFTKSKSNYLISDNVYDNEQLYIGGINSIRGYQENSIPSTQYSVLNTEYRIELSKNLYTHTVFDYGITKNNTSKDNINLIGFGLGFGLKSNNSLLRFIIANRKNRNENITFSESKIHLSLSTLF